jgi:ubiquitin conjugation factor E4 B
VDYLDSLQGSLIFPKGAMMIDSSIVPAGHNPDTKQSPAASFITQSFFMCWRVLHLGVVQQIEQYHNSVRGLSRFHSGLASNEPRAIHFLVQKITYDTVFLRPQFLRDIASFCSSAATVLMSVLAPERNNSQNTRDNWKVAPSTLTPTQLQFLTTIPPHLVSDIVTLLLFISKTDPGVLAKVALDDMLALIIYFLRRPWALVDYNIRAELGQALYQVFLPPTVEGLRREHWTNVDSKSTNGLHTSLLESSIDAQRYLAPALLLLYGDVERTGYYEKIGFRQNILVILRHLWSIPLHHEAFRGIVTGQEEFISFANGLMNETNHLVLTTMVLIHSLTYSLTYLLTYLLTYSHTHTLTHSLTHSLRTSCKTSRKHKCY